MTKRFSRFLLCLILVLAMILPCGCSSLSGRWQGILDFGSGSNNDQPAAGSALTVYQLIQKIVDAIHNDADVATAFASIPKSQLDGLTLDQFQQYVLLLRRGISGDITSFSQMSDAEIEDVRTRILERLPGQTALTAGLQGFWIYYLETGRSENQFALFIQQNDKQETYLSTEWVNRILSLSNLADLYFDAIDHDNSEALSVLMQNGTVPAKTLNQKALRIIDFYKNNISSQTDDFRLSHARIDGLGFEEFGITNLDQSQAVSRTIELQAKADGTFKFDDVIPDVLDEQDLQVLYQDEPLLEFCKTKDGEQVQIKSGSLQNVIGLPLLHDDSNCQETASGSSQIDLQYESLNLTVEGTCINHKRWYGQIIRLLLNDPACSLASGLKPGMPVQEILDFYPFAADTNYLIRGKFADGTVQLQFHLSGDQVESLELTWVND